MLPPAPLRPLARPAARLALVLALGAASACDTESAPSAGPAPGAGAPALAPQPLPTVALVRPGDPPLAPLRLVAPAPGAERRVQVASDFTVVLRQDGAALPPRQLSERRSATVVHDGADPAGLSTYALVLGPQTREGAPAPAGLEGRQARWTLDDRGRVHGLGVDTTGLSPEAAAQLQSMVAAFSASHAVLPDEPVGVGAQWTVTETLDQPEGTETRRTTWLLMSRDDQGMVLSGQTEGLLAPDPPAATGLQRRSLRGEGRVAVMHGTVLPARVDSRGHSAREAVLTRPDGKPGALATETRWTTVLEDAPGAP